MEPVSENGTRVDFLIDHFISKFFNKHASKDSYFASEIIDTITTRWCERLYFSLCLRMIFLWTAHNFLDSFSSLLNSS